MRRARLAREARQRRRQRPRMEQGTFPALLRGLDLEPLLRPAVLAALRAVLLKRRWDHSPQIDPPTGGRVTAWGWDWRP
jgi:hypothetical protein